jgi:hypothetical protein
VKRYYFNPETGVYLGEAKAPIDPRETKRQGKTVYMEHPNATFTAPPEIEQGKIAVFKENKWSLEDIPKEPDPVAEPTRELTEEEKTEAAIRAEMQQILREQAIDRLVEKGILTQADKERMLSAEII